MILQADEAVVVTAHDEFVDTLPNGAFVQFQLCVSVCYLDVRTATGKTVQRGPGDKWMIHGPTEFIPKTEIGKFERRKTIPLNENEGVYVRDIQSGQVRCVHGPQAYMIQANEELYEKELTPLVEDLLRYTTITLCYLVVCVWSVAHCVRMYCIVSTSFVLCKVAFPFHADMVVVLEMPPLESSPILMALLTPSTRLVSTSQDGTLLFIVTLTPPVPRPYSSDYIPLS